MLDWYYNLINKNEVMFWEYLDIIFKTHNDENLRTYGLLWILDIIFDFNRYVLS